MLYIRTGCSYNCSFVSLLLGDHGVWNQPPTDPYNGQVMLLHPSSTPTQGA